MVKNVKVIASDTNEVLLETTVDKLDEAYKFASQMDQMGINVEVLAPTITETLSDTLGLSLDDKYHYEKSIDQELEDHDGSCCVKKAD